MICLGGGPSHIDTYDMRPDAPSEYRGEFRPIASKVPGMPMCELMPRQAAIADRFAVIRSMTWKEPCHQYSEICTGYPVKEARPGYGSVVKRPNPGRVASSSKVRITSASTTTLAKKSFPHAGHRQYPSPAAFPPSGRCGGIAGWFQGLLSPIRRVAWWE